MSQESTNISSGTKVSPSASSQIDYAVVQRAIGGDQSAFKILFDKYRQPLFFHILKLVRDREVIEDLLQEIFLKAFDNIASFNPDYAFSTWLYRITTNHSIDFLRKKKLKTFSLDEPVQTRDALDSLPVKYRDIIKMRHVEELSYQEIADLLNLPLGTVKAHIFRARELLYKYLKDRQGSF
jgi:DNA-directed RNA polymerase specialized sigma24 family protein